MVQGGRSELARDLRNGEGERQKYIQDDIRTKESRKGDVVME